MGILPDPPEDPRDERARMVANLDQALAGLDGMTSLVAAYWQGLVEKGLPPEFATHLTAEYQTAMIAVAFSADHE